MVQTRIVRPIAARPHLGNGRLQLPPLIVGIYVITCICGMLDAVCYLGLGQVFAEIMTGNLVYLVFSIGTLGTHGNNPALPYVVALSAFALGALIGGRLVRLPGWWGKHRIEFIVEWLALLGAVIATLIVHPQYHGSARYLVFGILAFGMGVQNVAVRRWGVPNLATNVMTLTMVALIADLRIAGGDNQSAGRRAASLAIFAVSAGFGAFLVRYGVLWGQVAALVIFTLALPILIFAEDVQKRLPAQHA
ncbi:MAG TPA: YoaK family protein [Acidimicrobiales bacterium]|nr:YoaK family protein [Acidimicrobiales bacterium]